MEDSLHLIEGASTAILTNQSGVDRRGVSDVDRLTGAAVDLRAIFSPEHGYRGALDEEGIGHSLDSMTGRPIYSLYGETRTPTPEMLAGIDVLLIDLQDIGTRSYTYISTAIRAMRAAGGAGVRVIVLDRPNPIGGRLTQGPVMEDSLASWLSYLDVPLRHGLTMGEMALYAEAYLDIDVDLTVIPVAGLTRDHWYDDTGLPWVRPSPNMPDIESATHYPGLVPFERTNLSVGRGTPIAFQLLGAPWLDAAATVARIGEMPGVTVTDTVFTPVAPGDGKYDSREVSGLRFRVTDRDAYDPVRLGVNVLAAVRDAPEFEIQPPGFDRRMGRAEVRVRVLSGEQPDSVWATFDGQIDEFKRRARAYLLYR